MDITGSMEKTADNRIVKFAFGIIMTVGVALLLVFVRASISDQAADRKEVNDQIKALSASISILTTTVGQIQVTITEGLRQTLDSQGRRIEVLEGRYDKLTDDQSQLRMLIIEGQADRHK